MNNKTVTKKEGVYSYTINDESKTDGKFTIPVTDVRDGKAARAKVNATLRANNIQAGSKFMKESFSGIGRSYRVHYPRS